MDSLDAMLDPPAASEHDEAALGELHELELASQLLDVSDANELDRFLRTLILRATSAKTGRPGGDTLRALHALLRKASRKTVPAAARALGARGEPSQLAGKRFGLELEGLSSEDQDFEVARRFVRFGACAARNAVNLCRRAGPHDAAPLRPGAGLHNAAPPRRRAGPRDVARAAVIQAARRLAPGLLRPRVEFPVLHAAAAH
jgi:hypothetical protein